MKEEQFVIWLKGVFDASEGKLSIFQWRMVQEKLQTVFDKVTAQYTNFFSIEKELEPIISLDCLDMFKCKQSDVVRGALTGSARPIEYTNGISC